MDRFRLESLNAGHSVENFHCEEHEIDSYLHEEALADMSRGVARTFVEIDNEKPETDNVAGFFTLRAHALHIDEAYFEDYEEATPDEQGRSGLDDSIEVPLVELMWLARDLRWKGQGIGALLMIDALSKVAAAGECIGFIGLHLRSTSRGVPLYKRFRFQQFKAHPHFDPYRYILSDRYDS